MTFPITLRTRLSEQLGQQMNDVMLDALTTPPPPRSYSDMDELIGRTVTALYVDPGQDDEDNEYIWLAVETDDGTYQYYVEGDCCSSSWFNDILGVQNLLGQTVTAVERVDMPEPPADLVNPQGYSYDCLQDYGIKLTTLLGYCDVIFRNESNGYYGGDLRFYSRDPDEVDLGGWVMILADWSRDG